ncbi:MAG: TonB family protein [Bdellovibrionales bacterium]|nr:TonB family protein [Bdellovibrionales bacterium]
MNADSRRLTLSILLASSLHAAVATTLLVVEEPKKDPFPEGEYIELGAIEVPEGMQVVQPEVKPTAPKKVVPKPKSVEVVEEQQPIVDEPSQQLPEKSQQSPEVALQPDTESSESVVTETTNTEPTETAVEELPVDENSEALAEEMLQEESEVLAAEKVAMLAKQQKPQKPKVDPVVERRKKLREKRMAELKKQQQKRAERWKNRKKQVAQSQATSTPYGLPNGSRDARTLSQLPGNPKPVYPAPARRKGWEGNVVLAYYVTSSGHVQGLKVLRSSGHQMLDQEAIRSISRYRYRPGQAGWTYHPVLFRLNGQAQVEFSGLRTQ